MKSIVVLLLASALGCLACNKSDKPIPSAAVTIAEPISGQAYHKGDTVSIHAIIECETVLHGYDIAIATRSGDTVYSASNHQHESKLLVRGEWVVTLDTPADISIWVSSQINHEGLRVGRSVEARIVR